MDRIRDGASDKLHILLMGAASFVCGVAVALTIECAAERLLTQLEPKFAYFSWRVTAATLCTAPLMIVSLLGSAFVS